MGVGVSGKHPVSCPRSLALRFARRHREGGVCPNQSSRSCRFCLAEVETVLWCPQKAHADTNCLCSVGEGLGSVPGEISRLGEPDLWAFEIEGTLVLEGHTPWDF